MLINYRAPDGEYITVEVEREPGDPSVGIYGSAYTLEGVDGNTDAESWPQWAAELAEDHEELERIYAEEVNETRVNQALDAAESRRHEEVHGW